MKKCILFLLSPFTVAIVSAQNALTIIPGTDLYISSSTILNIEGLSLTPSAAFSLSGVTVAKNNAVTNAGLSNTVSKAYLFSTSPGPFSGTVRFYYSDAEQGSVNESSLQIQTHNGSAWQSLGATLRAAADNYVEVTGVTNKILSEVALSENTALPLNWKRVVAQRQEKSVSIHWITSHELNVSHFSIERNVNNEGWRTVADNIKAANMSFEQEYTYIDADYITGKIAYRIRQTDLDGGFTYSKIVSPGTLNSSVVRLYPNPAVSSFIVQLNKPENVKEIQLYNVSGMLVKNWLTPQASYTIEYLPAGVYQLCILDNDGHRLSVPLIKN